jgi:hypothetical protein
MHLSLSIGARTLAVFLLIAATYFLGPIVPILVALGLMAVATYGKGVRPMIAPRGWLVVAIWAVALILIGLQAGGA